MPPAMSEMSDQLADKLSEFAEILLDVDPEEVRRKIERYQKLYDTLVRLRRDRSHSETEEPEVEIAVEPTPVNPLTYSGQPRYKSASVLVLEALNTGEKTKAELWEYVRLRSSVSEGSVHTALGTLKKGGLLKRVGERKVAGYRLPLAVYDLTSRPHTNGVHEEVVA